MSRHFKNNSSYYNLYYVIRLYVIVVNIICLLSSLKIIARPLPYTWSKEDNKRKKHTGIIKFCPGSIPLTLFWLLRAGNVHLKRSSYLCYRRPPDRRHIWSYMVALSDPVAGAVLAKCR